MISSQIELIVVPTMNFHHPSTVESESVFAQDEENGLTHTHSVKIGGLAGGDKYIRDSIVFKLATDPKVGRSVCVRDLCSSLSSKLQDYSTVN